MRRVRKENGEAVIELITKKMRLFKNRYVEGHESVSEGICAVVTALDIANPDWPATLAHSCESSLAVTYGLYSN
jgi:hypothetical protein